MSEPECMICGEWEDEHHAFKPYLPPEDCICDPREWGNPNKIPVICLAYERDDSADGLCAKCEHERSCHRVSR